MVSSCRVVSLRQLGIVQYTPTLSLQTQLVSKYKGHQKEQQVGEILVCQHDPPTYTFGLREKDVTDKMNSLHKLGAKAIKVRRGGLTTVHSVGQLVCYPILNLHMLKLGIRNYIKGLEQSIIRTCGEFGVTAYTTDDVGVWVGNAKVCSIGVQVSNGVTYHGLALNCNNDLSWFDHIIPCGLEGRKVTSLSQVLNYNITVNEVVPILIGFLLKEFNLSLKT